MRKDFKKNGPVRPIDIPWPKPENPVPSKRVGLKQGGRTGFQLGLLAKTAIKKGTKIRDYYAGLKKAHRLRKKLKTAEETRKNLEQSKTFKKKYIDPASQETKVKISQQISPKSWRRAGKLTRGWGNK